MKLNVLLCVAALLGAFLPPSADCRPVHAPTSPHLLLPRPLLLRLGEEMSLQLGGDGGSSSSALDLLSSSSSSSLVVTQALLQLTQHLLQARAEQQQQEKEEESGEKGKRSDDSPISLDLTFHLLREVLEMARAEQVAQQADSNRKMMDDFGK